MKADDTAVAYCGLCCDDCFAHKGRLAEMAKEMRQELRAERFDITVKGLPFPVFKKYPECYEVLGALVKLKCRPGCRGGGGNPFCAVRRCAQKKGYEGCWQCDVFTECKKLDFLKANHGDACLKNLARLKKSGVEGFLAGKRDWYVKPKV